MFWFQKAFHDFDRKTEGENGTIASLPGLGTRVINACFQIAGILQ